MPTLLRILEACGFAIDCQLSQRIRERGSLDRGRELEEVLNLAAQFPSRHNQDPALSEVWLPVTGLPANFVAIHTALAKAELPHTFGGALALRALEYP